MKTLVMRPGSLSLEERPMPEPGPGQVLVKTLACGICGSDLHLYRHAQELREQALALGVPDEILDRGVVLGHEFIGEIVAFGPDTEQALSSGSRVCSIPFVMHEGEKAPIGTTPYVDGAYAEYFILSEELLISVPEELPTDAAALTEPLGIGMHAVNKADLERHHAAVVMGCGPIGLAVIAVLKMRGVENIIAGDFSARRRELAGEMGAGTVIDASQADVFEGLDPTRSVAVFDCTGVSGVLNSAINSAPVNSEIVVAGVAHGEEAITPATAIAKELTLYFVLYYQDEEFAAALDALTSGAVNWKPWITGKVTLEGVEQAFEDLKNPEGHAKILIYPHAE